jgi:hypothetical protein
MSPPALRTTARLVAINASILLVGVVALELAFGDWIGEPSVRQLGLARDIDRRNDACGLYAGPDCIARYRRDRHGLRGDFADPAEIDLLTVVGSATDQRYIDETRTWQAVLRSELRRAGRGLTIGNAGVDGQSTFGHIRSLELWFPRVPGLAPRYYLFYAGVNDLLITGERGYDRLDAGGGWRELLRARSALYDVVRKLHGVYLARRVYGVGHSSIDFGGIDWVEDPLASGYESLMADGLAAYRARVLDLGRRVRELGAVPVFVTQPSREYRRRAGTLQGTPRIVSFRGVPTNGVDRHHMLIVLNRVTMEACAAAHGVCIDLAAELELDDDDFYDYFHNTPKGTAKIGRFLARKLELLM